MDEISAYVKADPLAHRLRHLSDKETHRRRHSRRLGSKLGEEITWDDRKVTSIDWQTYKTLSLGIQVPHNRECSHQPAWNGSDGRRGDGDPPVAAAIGNAIFDATGARVRQVPFTRYRVKAAIAARR
jgi:CO/xanthine dehydrogenase Mo-binding subunit